MLIAASGETTGLKWRAGGWTSFTPTLTAVTTNPTIGDGTLTGRYRKLDDKTVALRISWFFGSTSNAGSGNYTFALPGGMTAQGAQSLAGFLLDTSTRIFNVTGYLNAGATGILIVSDTNNPGWVSHNAPMTWATGDHLVLSGVIEIQ